MGDFVTIKQKGGRFVAESLGGSPLHPDTQRKVDYLLREKTPEERERSTRLYNEAAERMWGKLLAHREELVRPSYAAPERGHSWIEFVAANPVARQLAAEVDAELNYELSMMQCSWAVAMFLDYSPEQYAIETGITIEARI